MEMNRGKESEAVLQGMRWVSRAFGSFTVSHKQRHGCGLLPHRPTRGDDSTLHNQNHGYGLLTHMGNRVYDLSLHVGRRSLACSAQNPIPQCDSAGSG